MLKSEIYVYFTNITVATWYISKIIPVSTALSYVTTLKSLIEEHARLDFSDFLSTLLAIFHVINEKFPPARLLIYLVISKQGGTLFPSLLVYSGLLFY